MTNSNIINKIICLQLYFLNFRVALLEWGPSWPGWPRKPFYPRYSFDLDQ